MSRNKSEGLLRISMGSVSKCWVIGFFYDEGMLILLISMDGNLGVDLDD